MNNKILIILLSSLMSLALSAQVDENTPVRYFDSGAPAPALADDNGGWDVNHWIRSPDAGQETRDVWTQGAIAVFDLTGVGDFALDISYPLSGSSEAFYAADIGGLVFSPPADRTSPYNINGSGGGLMNFLSGAIVDVGDGAAGSDISFRNQRIGNGTPFRITGNFTKRGLGTLNITQIGGADFRSMAIEADILIEEGTIRIDNANRNPDSIVDLSTANISLADEGTLILASSRPYNSSIGLIGGTGTVSMARTGNGDAFTFRGFVPGGEQTIGNLLVRSIGPESQAISFAEDALLSYDLDSPENSDLINFSVTIQTLTIDFSALTFESFAFNPLDGFAAGEYKLMSLDVGEGNDITAVGFPTELTGMIGDFQARITLGGITDGRQDLVLTVEGDEIDPPCNAFEGQENWVFFDGSINNVAFGWGWVAPNAGGWTYSLALGWVFPVCGSQWMFQISEGGSRWVWVFEELAAEAAGVWIFPEGETQWSLVTFE